MSSNKKAGQTGQGTREDQSFIRAQQQKLTNLITQSVATALTAQQSVIQKQSLIISQEEWGLLSESKEINRWATFWAKNISYFDSQVNITENVIVKDWDMIYWNVFFSQIESESKLSQLNQS